MTANSRNQYSRFLLKVTPNASRNEILGYSDGVLRVRVAAPPVKGKTNRELIAFLSEVLGTNKSSLRIIKGATSRSKVVAIEGMTQEEILKRIQ